MQGFLDFAFSPLFDTNGYFYVSWTANDPVRLRGVTISGVCSPRLWLSGDGLTTSDTLQKNRLGAANRHFFLLVSESCQVTNDSNQC